MASSEDSDSLNGYKPILALVVFLLTNLVVIFPFRIRIPNPFRRTNTSQRRFVSIPIGLATAPPAAVLFLLATLTIDGTTLRRGILGADGIKPIDIMALFISLAYIAISLDATGLLRYLAFIIVARTKSGKKLYLGLYGLFFAFGAVVGNDPVILSGTAFLAYMTRVAGITPPTAWIFSQFCAANVASTILVSSNPTNLVLTGAFQISFTTYTANVILPSLASAILLVPYLLWCFRSRTKTSTNSLPSTSPPSSPHAPDLIPSTLHTSDLPDASTALVDPTGAKFGTILLLVTLAVLLATSAAGVHAPVYAITLPAAAIMLGRDLWWDIRGSGRRHAFEEKREPPIGDREAPFSASGPISSVDPHAGTDGIELRRMPSSATQETVTTPEVTNQVDTKATPSRRITSFLSTLKQRLPTSYTVFSRLPFPLIPFAFSMFILVQALGSPWITVFTKWWYAWASRTGPVGAVFGAYIVTVAGCNFMGTNIGATILLARVLQQWIAVHEPSKREAKGAIYALALGSNYGAFSASFSASLAGLLWKNILNQKGIQVSQVEFAKLNLPMNLVAMIGGCAVLLGQLYVAG